MLVITATSTELEAHPELLAATVVALACAIWILRYSAQKYIRAQQIESE